MGDQSESGASRYRAFISYSHRDDAFADRLHRRLERFALPKRLGVPRRLTPIFKDREELPAAHDLSVQVRAALADSDCLVVICSPDAAASHWVGREIETFRALHPDRPVLAALIRGEPAEAFPPALAAGGAEPLAADFRKRGDGDRLALLKLVAGIVGVGVDQLVQRDAQRRLHAVMAVTAVSFVAVLAMGLTTTFALNAQAEAERQRAEAESLVEFMLGDLRQQLKGVGRFSVLGSVNRRALAYYNRQERGGGLPDDSLERRSALLHAMGEDEAGQDRLDLATAHFDEAYRDTGTLLAKAPRDPERLFAHGQSAYWRGFAHFSRRRTADARAAWEEYRTLALRLKAAEPGAVRSIREAAHAEANLCALAVEQEGDPRRALDACNAALKGMQAVRARRPGDPIAALDVATRWARLADVQSELGDHEKAQTSRLTQAAILKDLLAKEPDNATYRDNWGVCQRGLSLIAYRRGDLAGAVAYLREAGATFHDLSQMDPVNSRWRDQAAYADRAIAILTEKQKGSRP